LLLTTTALRYLSENGHLAEDPNVGMSALSNWPKVL
jgi:hypothetical protein